MDAGVQPTDPEFWTDGEDELLRGRFWGGENADQIAGALGKESDPFSGRLLVKAGPGGAEAEPARALAELGLSNRGLEERLLQLEDSVEDVWEAVDHLQHDVEEVED